MTPLFARRDVLLTRTKQQCVRVRDRVYAWLDELGPNVVTPRLLSDYLVEMAFKLSYSGGRMPGITRARILFGRAVPAETASLQQQDEREALLDALIAQGV